MDDTEIKKLKADAIATYRFAYQHWEDNYFDLFRKNWKIYKRITDKDYPFNSKLFPPYAFSNCVLIHALLLDAVFANREIVSFAPNGQVNKDHSRQMDNLINTQFEKMNFFWSFWQHMQAAEIFLFSMGKVNWSKKLNCPVFYSLSPWSVFFDPTCGWDIQRAGYIHHSEPRTKHQIRELRDAGIYEITDDEIANLATISSLKKDEETSYYTRQYDSNDRLAEVEVLESHIGDKVITILGGAQENSVVARMIDKPIKLYPFVKTCLFPEVDEIHGEGLMNPAKDMQLGLQNFFNMIQEAGMKALSPGFITDDPDYEDEQFIWVPGAIKVIQRNHTFKPLEPPNIDPIFGKAEGDLRYNIDNSMGSPPIMRGEKEGQETLGGMAIRRESGGARTNLHIYAIGKSIEDTTKIMLEYNSRYFAEETFIDRNTGEDITMSFADIQGSETYKFVPICNTTPLKPMAQEKANVIYDKLFGNPYVNQPGLTEWYVNEQEIQEKHLLLNQEGQMPGMAPQMPGQPNLTEGQPPVQQPQIPGLPQVNQPIAGVAGI